MYGRAEGGCQCVCGGACVCIVGRKGWCQCACGGMYGREEGTDVCMEEGMVSAVCVNGVSMCVCDVWKGGRELCQWVCVWRGVRWKGRSRCVSTIVSWLIFMLLVLV